MNVLVAFVVFRTITFANGGDRTDENIPELEHFMDEEWIDFESRTSLQDGLKETWDWFLEHKEEFKSRKNYFIEDDS